MELTPQGTLAEKLELVVLAYRLFIPPAGVGTPIANGGEVRVFNNKEYLLQTALTADFSLVRAAHGDVDGNLVYNKTARNFNPMMAAAGEVTIAEVEQLSERGSINPDHVHTPGIYVQGLIEGEQEKRIERLTVRQEA